MRGSTQASRGAGAAMPPSQHAPQHPGSSEGWRRGLGRSIAYLAPEQANEFIRELDALVERFDAAHDTTRNERPFAFVWALYPSSRKIQ